MTLDIRILPGLTAYSEAHALQLQLVEQRRNHDITDTLLLLEHPPVITLGRNASSTGILASTEALQRRGIDVHHIERGGQATYHCPGQLVGYGIVHLGERNMGIAAYVRTLETILIDACAQLGVQAQTLPGKTGVFTTTATPAKLGAIGVRVSRGVTFHGFALNVTADLDGFGLIVPCGMTDMPVTSIAAVQSQPVSLTETRRAICHSVRHQL